MAMQRAADRITGTAQFLSRRARLTPGHVVFAEREPAACSSCSGCARANLQSADPGSLRAVLPAKLRAAAELDVVIGVPARQLLLGAAIGYGMPAFLLTAGALCGSLLDAPGGEFYAIGGGLGGLLVGSLLLRLYDSCCGSQLAVSAGG
ncbi:MAG: SoxR reducing system RseC family protein [Gammaproteobacteria bacterium]|jgi:positive regulator of sigma E activity|nr:SoxR reducing system RseC family protein [Gammaproteobacteria bacterium]